jgi:hypothetical protein
MGVRGSVVHDFYATDVSNLFATVVHDAPDPAVQVSGLVATIVHDAPAADTRVSNLFGTVVHSAPAVTARLSGLVASVVHDATGLPPSGGGPPLQGDRIRSHFHLQGSGLRLPPGGSVK